MSDKLDILIFVPTSSCACNFAGFMNRVFKAILPFKAYVKMDILDIESKEAEKYHLHGNSIVIPNPPGENKPKVFTTSMQLKNYLSKIFVAMQ